MNQNQKLEQQRREAESLVYRWFRFKTRRALGLLYCVFAFLPLVEEALYLVSDNSLVSLVGTVLVGWTCSIALRSSGYRGFGGMMNTIDMLQGKDTLRSSSGARRVIMWLVVAIWPLVGYVATTIIGEEQLYVPIAILWLVERIVISFWVFRRSNRPPILDPEIEDWLAAISFPIGALLSTLPIIPYAVHPYGFLLVSPLLAFCGIKSLYEAPKELAASLD